MTETREGAHWTVDKRIPLALVLTILMQTSAGVWWASAISTQVGFNSSRILAQETRIEQNRESAQQVDRTNVRLIEQISGMRESMNELKRAQNETNELLRAALKGE